LRSPTPGSLTVAAEQKLHTSQPSLSRQIRDLEQEVGVQLIHRSAHGVELTSAGKAFLDHARMALVQAEAAKKQRCAQLSRRDRLRSWLHVGPKLACCPRWTASFRDEFPASTSGCRVITLPCSPKLLMRRRLDAAFMRPEEPIGDLHYARVRYGPAVFVFPNDHRLASHARSRRKIVNETFYLPSKAAPAVRRIVLEYFNRAGIDLKPEHEVHNVVHAISMIHIDARVMLLPAYTKTLFARVNNDPSRTGEAPALDLVSLTTRQTSRRS